MELHVSLTVLAQIFWHLFCVLARSTSSQVPGSQFISAYFDFIKSRGGGGRCRRKSDASFSHRARWEFGAAVAVVVDGVPHEDPALARVQFRSSPTSPDQTHLVDWDLGVRPDGLPLRSVGDDASKAEGPPGRGADGVRKHDDDDGFTGFSWPHVVVLNSSPSSESSILP